ncbi:MAG TPA: amino acid adenylation domain-containing protein [Thermoanaerobaculia bacterium]|nr:amino acid adenylation domain-containing protein [Thermoanaerobaculia bacterium]
MVTLSSIETLRESSVLPVHQDLLHRLFEARVEEHPGREALVWGDARLTYGELARRAGRLACRLAALGIGPEVPVGICSRRSADMVVGMLAVLKAGGVYLPLDPKYPRERLRFMLEDAGAPVVLTDSEAALALPENRARLVFLDAPEALDGSAPAAPPSPENLAYLIYTSGSTGRPKGVAIPHRAAVHLMRWAREFFPPEDLAGVLAATSICFDLSVFEIFVPLSWGGRVILADNALALPAIPAAAEVTLVNTVPSAANELVRGGGFPPSVRTVNLAGEALQRSLVDQLYRNTSAAAVFNLYGPSEDTTYSTWARVPRNSAEAPTIGVPLPGETGHVLGMDLLLVPDGEEGELYLGGPALARGYLARPDLTAERFLPDPFSPDPGARMYKTGDLVRLRPDGELDFLGRIDNQVKIRGFRIELGEIEAALLAIPGVRECVVVASDARLVAYVAPSEVPIPELRRSLAARLPEHMVPSAFVLLLALPLTPNGKVDRKALPAPGRARPEVGAYAAPRDEVEERLAGLWAEALGLDAVGVEDDFFELGGHSLVAGRLLSRIRRSFGSGRSVRELFSEPTVAGFARLLRDGRESEDAVQLAGAARGLEAPPLSFGQQRLLFTHRLEADPITYNVPLAGTLSGDLDAAALRRAFTELVRRHEPLRTVFCTQDEEEVQVALPPAEVSLPVLDLSLLPAPEREEAARSIAWVESRTSFDLEQGPVLRAALLRLSEREHRLLLTVHHIAWDDGALAVVLRELPALYRSFAEGSPASLPPLPASYADYAVWQRERLQGPPLEGMLDRWMALLSPLPEPLELPGDRLRQALVSQRGGERLFEIPDRLAQGLRALARRHGATLFMSCLAVWEALLARLTGQEDLVVAAPAANRNRVELEAIAGFFVNTLVLRTDLSGDPALDEVVDRVRETTLTAFEFQELPLDLAVRRLNPLIPGGASTLLRTLFTLYPEIPEVELAPGLRMLLREAGNGTAKVDLSLFLEERSGGRGIGGRLEYAADLFDAATVQRIEGLLLALLEAGLADPQRRVSDLPLLSEAQRTQLFLEWNDTESGFPREACVHKLFEAQAALRPDAVALEKDGVEMTYAELDRRAGLLAGKLRELGVGPEVVVAIGLERSIEMIVAVLAVLKAGGAYLPLDPDNPAERLVFMLRDSGARALVTRRGLARTFRTSLPVLLTEEFPVDGFAGMASTAAGVTASNLAYVIYTSGSTGQPKGVAVTHRSILRLLIDTNYVDLGPEDRIAHVSNTSFDAAIFEIWSALLHGGRLVILERGLSLLPEEIEAEIRGRGITMMFLTTAVFQQVAAERPAALSALRDCFYGGEAGDPQLAREVLEAGPPERLLNVYGPTECTTYATWYPLRSSEDLPAGVNAVPIGRPISSTRTLVLDRHGAPVPLGAVGELFLGGDGLARGYLVRPGLTAERFVPDPLASEPGARLYRTGDLVRQRPDGVLDYVGRTDHQVKIHGLRIELGEIEAVLRAHPAVREAVVDVRRVAGARRLVSYVVPQPDGADDLRAVLREHLSASLPRYMVPPTLVRLESLPLTPVGKVDRRALPQPEDVERAGLYVAPRNPVETALAAIWSEVLKVERVGIRDEFFHLGGHSLLATQVQSRVRERLGVELPLVEVLRCATLAELAREVRNRWTGEVAETIPPRTEGSDRFPVSFSQLRLWLLDRMEPGTSAYNIPFPLRLDGQLDPELLRLCLNAVVRRHEALRTVFGYEGGEPVQAVLSATGELPLPLIDLSALPAEARESEAGRLAREESQRGFDLGRWPLLRTTLLRRGSLCHDLLLVLHHIVGDGWSMGVLFRELGALYEAFFDGRPSPLPELSIQYPDFAVWQRSRLQGETLDRLLGYWRGQLGGAEHVLELPTDRRRPSVMTYRGGQEVLWLPQETIDALQSSERHGRGRTQFMTLLSAFEVLLSRWSGQDDFCVGTFIANRNRAETEGLIGFFINTLILRADLGALGDQPSFGRLLDQVRDVTLGAYAHQDLPLERLLEALQPRRDPSRTPVFQTMLVFHNLPMSELRFGGLGMSYLPAELKRSNFDLTFWFQPHEHGGLEMEIQYAADLFDPSTIQRLVGQYLRLLEAALKEPGTPLTQLPLLGEEERRQVIADWNRTAAETGADMPVHALFEAQARRVPDKPAVAAGGAVLTYAELDRRSTSLARALRRRGVGPETVVGIQLRRSPELIVALLAVLKAGGAYLPLDPDYPRERLDFMIKDAGAGLVLTGTEMEEEGAELPAADPANLAYVIYTSGSTGRPKGVMVTHRSLSNHTASAVDGYEIRESDRILQFAALSFDTSAEEIWPCLAAGATLVLRDDSMLTSAGQFLAAADRLRITVLNFPTAYWHEIASGLEREGAPMPPSVRLVIVGGERMLADRIESWFRGLRGRDVRLMNGYGPTEGTIVATRSVVEPGRLAMSGEPLMGRPIHNAQVYVLDREGEPAPIGVPGELYIGGMGVARGYLGRPDLTAERFVPNPFGGEPGARLYCTGDRVRWLASGELDFLGRVDQQVKIRGFRVEVGEVEEALRRLPGVRDAVVEARPDGSGTQRLVAWVVPDGEAPADLRGLLKERLPDYMVPSAFLPLREVPKTPSNKIDRKALPEPEPLRPEGAAYAEPQSELERIVSGIWQQVLGVEKVGVHDNFFDLGGHSLLMIQAHGRLREALGRDLDILLLFQRPTVSALARELSQKPAERPAFTQAQQMVRQQRQVNAGRKQLMEQMIQQRKGRT